MTGSEEVPVAHRMILNANQGVTNIIEHDVIRRDMGKVTDSIFSKLKDHYGPFSSFAGLDSNKPLEDTVFTKDGANIIKAIEFASPLEDWVRRAVSYIGTNIETAAGDGTTSSMMFACGMLKHMSATIERMKPLSYNMLCSAWNELVANIKQYMKPYILTAKTGDKYSPDRVYDLAYMQAYTSSHGNNELSEAVAKMFKCTPSNMWGQMTFKRRRYESTNLFEVHESQMQYEMEADILSKTVYNKDAGRYLEYTNATLIIVNDKICIDNIHWKAIEEEINKSSKEAPVAILSYSDYDNGTFGELMHLTSEKDGENLKHCFAVFGCRPAHPKINDFTVIQSIAGKNVMEYSDGEFAGRPCIIRGVTIKYEFEKLQLDHLYEDTREKVDFIRERPYYNDPEHPYYREYADTIKKFIDAYESGDLNHSQQIELKSFRNLYNRLVYDKEIYLIIGGRTFDNLAMFDVVDDVVRACIRSLENGLVISNNKTLYVATCEVIQHYKAQKKLHADFSRRENLQMWLADCIINTLDSFSDVVLDQLYPNGKEHFTDYKPNMFLFSNWFNNWFGSDDIFGSAPHYERYDPEMDHICRKANARFTKEDREQFRNWWFSNSVNMLVYDNTITWDKQSQFCATSFRHYLKRKYERMSMIVQPSNADIVMLERFGEIALKFILTERVIVSGSAYLNKEKKK